MLRIKKGDTVKVLSGNDKGKTGEVLEVIPKTEKILVKGINIKKKHVKPRRAGEEGGIISNTSPVFPLSFPDKTCTVSPFFIFIYSFTSLSIF